MPSDDMNKDTSAKPLSVVVLGKGVVGKTSLIYRFVKDAFPEAHDPTIEDNYKAMVEINNESIEIQIVDTAGEEDYQNMLDQWIDVADGFLLVFAINDKESFNALKGKYDRIMKVKGSNCPIILVGNKCDLESSREVQEAEAKELAQSWNCEYVETSALKEINCKTPFISLSSKLVKEKKKGKVNEEMPTKKEKDNKWGCFKLYKCIIF